MRLLLLAIAPIIYGFTELSVNWVNRDAGTVALMVSKHDPMMSDCAQSGSEVYYRYEYMLCRRRSMWLDNCDEKRIVTRTLSWDPITDNYTVASDILGDPQEAVTMSYPTFPEAVEDLANVKLVELAKLPAKSRRGYYLKARMKFVCKGQTSKTLDRISSIMTLGLVSVGTADSGWTDFPLDGAR